MRTIITSCLSISFMWSIVACELEHRDDDYEDRKGEENAVRALAAGRGIGPLDPPPPVRAELVELGRALAFDRELSGNRDISCMTCHHPSLASADARHLAIGQGASGLGAGRVHDEAAFIARNAPPFFNLHVMDKLFWDGRVSVDAQGNLDTPAEEQVTPEMIDVFEFGAASAIGLFPVHSRIEMRGDTGNELATIDDSNFTAIWDGLMTRLGAIPQYRTMFEAAYPGTAFDDMTFAHASNAIGGFMISEFSATDTPWDEFLRGDNHAMTKQQLDGAKLFLEARCSICHGGDALTDLDFHNVALRQFGPGAGNGPNLRDDWGRWNVTGTGKYAFRSTPLRNVELTAPYGHAGQFVGLFDFIDHYSESATKLTDYHVEQIEPLLRATLLDNAADVLATRDPLLDGVVFTPEIVASVTAFMGALTDPSSRLLLDHVPASVPSGLPVDLTPMGDDPMEITLLDETFVVVVNPQKNTANQKNVENPGTVRSGVAVLTDITSMHVEVTGDEGIVVLEPLPVGPRTLFFTAPSIDRSMKRSAVAGMLIDVVVSVKTTAAKEMLRVEYATVHDLAVVVVDPGTPALTVQDALDDNKQVVVFSAGVYEGDFVIDGDENIVFGATSAGSNIVIDGSLTVVGKKNKVRGMIALGDVTIQGDDNALTFSRVEGDVALSGKNNVLLQNTLCGGFSNRGNDLTAVSNRGLAPIAAPDCL